MSLVPKNGWQPLGIRRRLVEDLLAISQRLPLFPLEREFELGQLAALRAASNPRISWVALFVKAYGLLAADIVELRQTYMQLPWPHLFQHDHSVAMVAVNRSTPEGDRLFWGRFTAPEKLALAEIQAQLDQYKHDPIEETFRRQIRFSLFPRPLRRLGWWMTLNLSAERRARRIGTFGLSTVAGLGAINRFHPTCTTTSFTYGPLSADGRTLVTVVYDHRVIDGAPLARALAELEAILQGPIADELTAMQRRVSAA
ncbi:MAG TPA: hypothetical protein VMF30_11145 [Pirellulales bacterium]|nr:hypothetical protein [Pirellulales bacterium]